MPAGALHGDPLEFKTHLPAHTLHVLTQRQCRQPTSLPTDACLSLSPQVSTDDIVSLQTSDPTLNKLYPLIQDPTATAPDPATLESLPDLRALLKLRSSLHVIKGVQLYVPDEHTSPRLVVPQVQRVGDAIIRT